MHMCTYVFWTMKSLIDHTFYLFSLEKQANDEELATGDEVHGKKYQPAKAPIVKAPLFRPATQKFMAAL